MAPPKAAKRPEKGVSFPLTGNGDRSTSVLGKNAIAAALRGAGTSEGDAFAEKCEKEKNWRFKYQNHFSNMVKVSASSPEAALGCANAGLAYMHSTMEFVNTTNAAVCKLDEYMTKQAPSEGTFHTGTVEGTAPKGGCAVSVPYKNKVLSGETLKKQLEKWAKYGTIEADAAAAIGQIADGNLDLADKHFVLIGAGSAMGPFIKLLEHGATVICVDIPGSFGDRPTEMWKRLFDTARKSAGKILFPLSKPQSECGSSDDDLIKFIGCNLLEQPAQILNWLSAVAPGKQLTVGNYTYLDGDLHVKLSLTSDAIMKHLCTTRKGTGIAFLCTPTDHHVVPEAAHKMALKNYGFHAGKIVETLINLLSMGKLLRKNALKPIMCKDKPLYLIDGLSVAQGPNYALAKRVQHWRAMIQYEAGSGVVSTHIAPSTATLSVVSNRSFGWAYGGMPYFKPYEIFQQETTNALMGSLLAYDVVCPDSGASPKNRAKYSIVNTLELFKLCSLHGGVWRAAYKVDSIGETSVIIHFMGGPKMFLPVMAMIFAAIAFLLAKFVFHVV